MHDPFLKLQKIRPEWHFEVFIRDEWVSLPACSGTPELDHSALGGHWCIHREKGSLLLSMEAPFPTALRLTLHCPGFKNPKHLIPCNLFGDNNAAFAKPGEFPLLTNEQTEIPFCSPLWEFRADRAAMPAAFLYDPSLTAALSVDPYAESDAGPVPCGLIAALPDGIGVSLGYTNRPCTFLNRSTPAPSTWKRTCRAQAVCRLYVAEGGWEAVDSIIRKEYALRHERAVFHHTVEQAADAVFHALVHVNWDEDAAEYTNRSCCPPEKTVLRPWRNVTEIGWTGGGILALPMLEYSVLKKGFSASDWGKARDAYAFFDRICQCFDPVSGLLKDLMAPNAEGSRLNGWWTYYGLVRDCHCAYNSGTAVYSLLEAVRFLKAHGRAFPQTWLDTAGKVLDTVTALQRKDGAFGYTYAADRKAVLDWDGFAGCWFVPCCALYARLTGKEHYLACAKAGLACYAVQVEEMRCSGSPMDTWKAVDQEGNIAFVKGCREIYALDPDPEYIRLMQAGAAYETLWRYGYRTLPENPPLLDGWCACGGSVTSVSNPHIHPMGVLLDTDLRFLARLTGDDYPLSRALDSTAWLMQTLELYPEKTGYGTYGVLSERWCPSDGLVTERNSEGKPYSSWFSYNLWAAADALWALCSLMEEKADA